MRPKFDGWWVFEFLFFNSGLKGIIEKCMGWFLLYLFLRVLFFLKRYCGNGSLNFCVKLICWVAAKHTTVMLYLFLTLNTCRWIWVFLLLTLNIYLSVGHRIKFTKQLKCTLNNMAVSLKHVHLTWMSQHGLINP